MKLAADTKQAEWQGFGGFCQAMLCLGLAFTSQASAYELWFRFCVFMEFFILFFFVLFLWPSPLFCLFCPILVCCVVTREKNKGCGCGWGGSGM